MSTFKNKNSLGTTEAEISKKNFKNTEEARPELTGSYKKAGREMRGNTNKEINSKFTCNSKTAKMISRLHFSVGLGCQAKQFVSL